MMLKFLICAASIVKTLIQISNPRSAVHVKSERNRVIGNRLKKRKFDGAPERGASAPRDSKQPSWKGSAPAPVLRSFSEGVPGAVSRASRLTLRGEISVPFSASQTLIFGARRTEKRPRRA